MQRHPKHLPVSGPFSGCYFLPSAQDFGDSPRLRDAAARSEGGIAIEDFAQSAEATCVNLATERLEKTQRCLAIVVDTVMRKPEGPPQPTPDGTLMISGVTITRAASVTTGISRFAGREPAPTERGRARC